MNPTAILVRGYGPASRVNNMIHPPAMLLECRHFSTREAGVTPWSHVEAREPVVFAPGAPATRKDPAESQIRPPGTPSPISSRFASRSRGSAASGGQPCVTGRGRLAPSPAPSNYAYRYSHTKVCSRFGELAGRHRNHVMVHRPPGSLVPFHGCYG